MGGGFHQNPQLLRCRKFCPSGIWNLELILPKEQGLFGPKVRFLALFSPVSVFLGPFLTLSSSFDEQKKQYSYKFLVEFFTLKLMDGVQRGGRTPRIRNSFFAKNLVSSGIWNLKLTLLKEQFLVQKLYSWFFSLVLAFLV